MQMPKNTGAYVRGALVGAIALAVIGFSWGGWQTGSGAARNAAAAAHDAVVAALTPICVAGFRGQTDATAQTAGLAKAGTWERGGMVEKSGFATMPGSKAATADVAHACAEILVNPAPAKN